ncbi:unnamed protein product [Blepharisma stoltei]|uniref:Uncharacterized protein n=1 Tax=Blepharisma stoltei TaxID=1481888 RepID=A0AAU9JEN2_9CILI|nr:unnamed protein product [Blepharisma stoltei]
MVWEFINISNRIWFFYISSDDFQLRLQNSTKFVFTSIKQETIKKLMEFSLIKFKSFSVKKIKMFLIKLIDFFLKISISFLVY